MRVCRIDIITPLNVQWNLQVFLCWKFLCGKVINYSSFLTVIVTYPLLSDNISSLYYNKIATNCSFQQQTFVFS